MGFNPTFRTKVQQLAHTKEAELKEIEIYLSPEFKRYLEMLSATFMGNYGKPATVNIIADEDCDITAFTDKDRITLNCQTSIIKTFALEEARFMALMGLFFHENAHKLYLDFDTSAMADRMLLDKGNLYPMHTPEQAGFSKEDEKVWAEITAGVSSDRATRQVVSFILHQVENIVADVHDEEKMLEDYGSFVAEGILKAREALRATATPVDDVLIKLKKDGEKLDADKKLTILFNLILFYARFNTALVYDRDVYAASEFKPVLQSITPYIEVARTTDLMEERYDAMHHILVALWPYIKELADKVQQQEQQQNQGSDGQPQQDQGSAGQPQQGQGSGNGQQPQNGQGQQNQSQSGQQQSQSTGNQGQQSQSSGGQSQQNGLSDKQLKEILEALQNGANNSGSSTAPAQDNRSSKLAKDPKQNQAGNNGQQKDSNGNDKREESKDALYRALNQLKQELAQQKAEQEVEKAMASSLKNTVCAVDQNSGHIGVPLRVERNLTVSESNIATYDRIMQDVKGYSKRLQRQITELLRDLKDGEVSKHRPYGKILCPTDAYRVDQKYYANKKLPQDLPNMAVSILVDNSGSMAGENRITYAMKAAMLLYDFATGINVPVAVAGHCAGRGVTYSIFADYDRVNTKDKYRIAKMEPGGCNRDGMALEISANLLSKRPEDIKVLFIISDGRPNDTGYGGDAAVKDIQSIVKKYQKRGVTVIAAAIGSDKETIRKIYGDGFLDITDLSKLPKTLTNIVRKKIIANL